jgi:hypothetical protein
VKDSEQRKIREDERRIVAALRSGGTLSDLKAEETVTRVKLLMAQGRLVFEKVSPRAHEALFSNRALRNRFLASKSACAAFITSIDIRRSAELMLNARSMELFGNIRFMRIAGDLTVVGAPVVNAARLSSAPVGKTVLNQQAHERIASHYGAFCSTSEMELDIKHQGRVLVHEVKLKKLSFVPSDPPWLDSKER